MCTSDDPINVSRPSSFPEFDFESTHMPGFDLSNKLLYQITVPIVTVLIGIDDIILLLEFCLKSTYFSFQGQFFEQVEGAAMGSPVSPIVANLYMEYL